MQQSTARRRAPAGLLAAVLSASLLLSGCGGDDDRSQAVDPVVTELAAHDGIPCPDELPQLDGPDTGLGGDNPAGAAPQLQDVEKAWICQYSPKDAAPGPEGDGNPWTWPLEGKPHPVEPSLIQDLKVSLSQLVPPAADLICTADIGQRWMLAYSTGGDLTGVVVDDFGCRSVRLTNEPFESVPGLASVGGIVPGYLTGPDTLLAQIKAAAG